MKKWRIWIASILAFLAFIALFFDTSIVFKWIFILVDAFIQIIALNWILFILLIIMATAIVLPYKKLFSNLKMITRFFRKLIRGKIGKIAVTVLFMSVFSLYYQQSGEIDTLAIVIIILSILPWVYSLIDNLELPGGIKIGLKNIEAARKLVADEGPQRHEISPQIYSFQAILQADPSIAMVALRIEIETRLRNIAQKYDLKPSASLGSIFRELRNKAILSESEFYGMEELISVGNEAAHGKRIESKVIEWATEYAPVVLQILDQK